MTSNSSNKPAISMSAAPLGEDLFNVRSRRIASQFEAIGLSRLKKKWKPNSVCGSLFQRELGFPYYREDDGWLDEHISRQLLSARGSKGCELLSCEPPGLKEDVPMKLSKQLAPTTNSKWTKMKLIDFNKSQRPTAAKCDFVDDKLMIEESFSGKTIRRFITINPVPGNTYHLEFKLITKGPKKKWHCFDVWYVGNLIPNPKKANQGVAKVPNTLFALEDRKLLLFDVNNGTKLCELELTFPDESDGHPSPKYSSLNIDTNIIYVEASKSSLTKDLFHEILVLSYPPLSLLYRVQILKGVIGKGYTDATNLDSLFLFFKSSSVELFSFDDMLRENQENDSAQDNSDTFDYKKVIIKTKPTPVLSTVKLKNKFLAFVPRIWPPHVFTRSKEFYEIYNLQNPDVPVATLPYDSSIIESSLSSFCNSPYLLHSGLPQGLEIHKVCHALSQLAQTGSMEEYSTSTLTVFTTKNDIKTDHNNSTNFPDPVDLVQPQQRSARGLRNLPRKYYGGIDEKQTTYGFDYNPMMELFAVCSLSNSTNILDITLFDNVTMKEFKRLQPVKITVPQNCKEFSFPKIDVNFQNTFLSVKVHISSHLESQIVELYTINLLSEEPDM